MASSMPRRTTAPPPPTRHRPTPTTRSTTAPASLPPISPCPRRRRYRAMPASPDADTDNDGLPDARRHRAPQRRGPLRRPHRLRWPPEPRRRRHHERRQRQRHPRPHRRRRQRPSWDTDNDGVLDGVECQLGTNPRLASSKPSPRLRRQRPTLTTMVSSRPPSGASGVRRTRTPTPTATARRTASRPTTPTATASQNFPGDTVNSAKAANGIIGKTMDFDLNGDGVVNFPGDTILSAKMVNHVGGIC